MAVPSVTFDGTRINASDANTNWGNFGSGGGAPAAEAQISYQNSLAVNTKHAGTALDGIDYDHSGTASINMTTAGNKLWFAKCIVADGADTNATKGAVLFIGSSVANYSAYVVAGTGELSNTGVFAVYPPQLGYIITSINPNVTTWNDTALDLGTIDQTAVDWFAFQGAMVVGGAKGENVALDSIDVGRGLNLVGGDGVSTDAVFSDFVTADEGTSTNRWGVVFSKFGIVYAQGWLVIGRNASGTVVHTDFTDPDGVVVFPDAYVDEGDFGVEFDISDASSVMDFGGTIIGRGSLVSGDDTRPDLLVTEDGTAGTLALSCKLQNFRNITLTDGVVADGASFQFLDMTQAGAHILNTTLTTTSAANVGALNDATFGTSTGIHDTEFIQGGLGHAVEVDGTSQTITLTNMTWTGYGSTGTSSAAIDFTGTGTHTVNWSGGTAPTVNNSGTGTVNIVNSVAVTVTCLDADTLTAISGARVLVLAATGGDLPFNDVVTITTSGTTASVAHTAHTLANGDKIQIKGATNDEELNGVKTISNVSTNAYDYTIVSIGGASGAGTILATAVIIDETTTGSGVADNAAFAFTNDQDISGRARKSTTSPLYKTSAITGTITSAGLSTTVVMISDE